MNGHSDTDSANSELTRSVLGTWRFGIAVCCFTLASIAIRDLFDSKDLYPAFLLPLLILGFIVQRFGRWHLVTLWSVLGVLVGELVAFVFGLHGFIVFNEITYTLRHHIIATSIHLLSEIVLSATLATIGARITTIDYDEDGVMRSIDIKRALNLRLLLFAGALPLLIGVVRLIEVRVISSLTNVETSALLFMQSDLLGYFMMTPLLIGASFTLVKAPNLYPFWRPKRGFFSIYTGLLILSCSLIEAKIVDFTFPTVMAISTVLAFIGMLTPALHIAGSLLLLNHIFLFFSLQHVEVEPIEVIIAVTVLSVGTYVIMLLRTVAQYEMNKSQQKVESLLATAQSYLESGLNTYAVQDSDFNIVFASKAFTELTGFTVDTLPPPQILYENYDDTFSKQHRQRVSDAAFGEIVEDDELRTLICADGTCKIVKRSNRKFEGADGAIYHMVALEDQTELQNALKAANTFLDSQLTAVAIQREDFSFYYISDAFKEQLGISSIEDLKDPVNGFWENRDEAAVLKTREVLRALPTGVLNVHPDPFIFVTAAGERLYFKVQAKWIDNPSGEGRLLLNSAENITELLAQQQRILDQANILENQTEELAISNEELLRRNALIEQQKTELRAKNIQLEDQSAELEVQVEELTTTEDELQHRAIELQKMNDQLAHQARTDPLTGLVNRLGLSERLKRDTNSLRDNNLALYLLDLDYFKSVNDTYSHAVGDTLLKEIAKSLQLVVWPEDIVCRYGGEEFVIVTKYATKRETIKFGEALRSALNSAAVLYDGHHVSRTASIGCVKLGKSMSQSEALHLADLAMMEGKQRGRDKVIFADSAFLKEMQERGAFITDEQVGDALHRGEICYYVQPIYDTHTDTIRGFEALARWVKPEGDVILPKKFISKFVSIAFTEKYWAARQKMSVELLSALRSFPECYVSINLKLEHFENSTFIDRMIETGGELHSETKTRHRFIFEISEDAMTQRVDLDVIRNNLQRIRDKGYLIALDDFGIEHSNFSRLLDLPIDMIKLDRKMIQNAAKNEAAEIILKSIVRMAHSLDIMTVAEGVETQAQAQMVSDAGVFLQQGFLHAHPMPLDQLKAISPNIDVESNTLH